MRYIIQRKNNYRLANDYDFTNGLSVSCRSKKYDIKKVIIFDETLKFEYIKSKIDNKLSKILSLITKIFNGDESDGDSEIVLDGFEKLREIIRREYREHMDEVRFNELMERIDLTEREFRHGYNEARMIENSFMAFTENEGLYM